MPIYYNRDEEAIERMIAYAERFTGIGYMWGGDDPLAGFDCSGFVNEALLSVGMSPFKAKPSAAQLFDHFIQQPTIVELDEPCRGALVFVKKGASIVHIELCLDDRFSISASGGDGTVVNAEDAINKNAFVKQRKIKRWAADYQLLFLDIFKEV